jgi:hypothetical protein
VVQRGYGSTWRSSASYTDTMIEFPVEGGGFVGYPVQDRVDVPLGTAEPVRARGCDTRGSMGLPSRRRICG